MLVLEDLHWADKPTALLLTHLVRSIQAERVLIIGTYRDTDIGEPLAGMLADLRREQALERLRLGSLHRGEVATMISAWLGRTPPTHFAHALHRETEGNPFFIEEVLRHLIEVAAADRTEWERLASFSKLGIPDGVREAIEQRLARLSADARRIVTMAAAIGRSFSIAVLDDLAELSGERLLVALEEAAERRILEEEAGPPGRYAFAHALIRETLYASLSGPRRVSLHRRIGAILEERHAGDPDPPLGELAYHFVEAAEPGAAAKAVDYSARAGRRALTALAYEEAAAPLQPRARGPRALRVRRRRDPLRPDARPRRILQQGERVRPQPLRLRDGRRARAHRRPRRAPRPRGARPRPGVDRAGHGRARDHRGAAGGVGGAARGRHRGPGQAVGRLAMELHFADEPERCRALARQGVELARRLGDASTLAFALNARHWAERGRDEVSELLVIADEIICQAEASEELELALQGHSWRLVDLLELGQVEQIDDEIAACASLAERLAQPFYRSWVAGLHPMRALMQGRFDEAERLAREALAAAEAAHNWNGITSSRVQLGWCWKDVGLAAEPGRRG